MWKMLPAKFSLSCSYSSFLFFSIWVLLFTKMGLAQDNTTIPVKIGVVLDLETEFGMMSLSCINMALSEFYSSHSNYKTRLVLSSKDSNRDVVRAASAGLDLIKNGQVQAILGPETSMEANFMIKLGDKAHVPIVTFSASSASLASFLPQYFVRATQNDSSQVAAIGALVQAYQWREAVLVYVDDEYGQGIIPFLTDALQAVNTRVSYRSAISSSASSDEIEAELYMLMTMQTRVFIVHMLPSLGSRVFSIAKRIGMMSEGFVWIMTDSMTNLLTSLNNSVRDSMQGSLGVKPYVPITKELEEFQVRWKRKFQQDNPAVVGVELNVFGYRAYDAVVAIAMAAENAVNSTNFLVFQSPENGAANSTTDLDSIGVSQSGPLFLKALLKTTFNGLSGEFRLIDRQLQSSTFQLVNINGNGERVIGYWTPNRGLSRNLNSSATINSTSNSSILGTIIWPGDSTSIPKGWEIPTNEPTMQIAVPVKHGFPQFVKMVTDPRTNATTFTGYCIDVFDAVMKSLPYAVPYKFVPYHGPNGEQPNYDDMISKVSLGIFGAVVGDTTIRASRSKNVDFTLPYTESGVSMIVPIKDNKRNSAWVFLKPLTWDLWATSGCFFVFIGFVVWVLEHRINDDFRGPPAFQVGTSFWFSFSTMVFAHREKVVSNLARFVVIIWCFVVLILTQSYTASLTSLLTVQQLRPTVNDVHELIKNQENVGYQAGSFVYELLTGLGFDEKKLKPYGSVEECHELFEKGTAKGGIAAAFDEVPYLRIFLAKYCYKYTMVDPTFKTAGFGFVFPRNSPLVPDVSRAILKVTERDKMKNIENASLGNESTCSNSNPSVSSSSLGLDSFWGLFLIAGVASTFALLIFAVMFVYEQRNMLKTSDSESSKWRKIRELARIFNQKDLTSHTFKKSKPDEGRRIHGNGQSPSTHCYPSPSSFDHSFTSFGEQGTPSPDHGDPNNPNAQVTEEIDVVIELANHSQEQQRIPEHNP